jgi:hypothetical protein
MEITRITQCFSQETVTLIFVFHLIMLDCYENKTQWNTRHIFQAHVFHTYMYKKQFLSLISMWGNKSLNKPLVAEVIIRTKLFYQVTVNFTFWVLLLMSASPSLHISTHISLMRHVLWPSQHEQSLNNTYTSTVSSLTHFAFSTACTEDEYQVTNEHKIMHIPLLQKLSIMKLL